MLGCLACPSGRTQSLTVNTNLKLVVNSLLSSMKRLFDETLLCLFSAIISVGCLLWSFFAFDVVQISLILSLMSASPQLNRPRLSSGNEGKLHQLTMNVKMSLWFQFLNSEAAPVGVFLVPQFSEQCLQR